jgi:hypothetical protein
LTAVNNAGLFRAVMWTPGPMIFFRGHHCMFERSSVCHASQIHAWIK